MDLRRIAHYYNYAYIGIALGIAAYIVYALITFTFIGSGLFVVASVLGASTVVLVLLNVLAEASLEAKRPKGGR